MTTLDDKMRSCPLKQKIRVDLWEHFTRKIISSGAKIQRYLTLYSPPMVDIKHFKEVGLLDLEDGTYLGVTAVGLNYHACQQAIADGRARPELLIGGNIHDLLNTSSNIRNAETRRLHDSFPFDVINLDYTNSIFSTQTVHEVSEHLKAIKTILKKQKENGATQFVMFVTTRADEGIFATSFMSLLKRRIDANNKIVPFKELFETIYPNTKTDELLNQNHDEFVTLGIVKLLAKMCAALKIRVVEVGANWLIRDDQQTTEKLLHLAFHLEAVNSTALEELSQDDWAFEENVLSFLNGIRQIVKLFESRDKSSLTPVYADYLKMLNEQSFEEPIPTPISSTTETPLDEVQPQNN